MSIGLDQRTHVLLGKETVTGVTDDHNPGVYPGEDHAWSSQRFLDNLSVKISKCNKTEVEVDLVGIDASVANAIRRIMMAEVPTVAVENVYIWNNTSVIQDEVLSQRLGLVPLRINPGKIEFKGNNDDPTDLNTVVFSLVIACTTKRITSHAKRSDSLSEPMYENEHVYSSSFSWQAKGVQEESFASDPPRPVQDDILLAKLRPGQEIILEMHCEKGVGREHAKWSPVGTASYRLMPAIKLLQPIPSELCDKFAACFAPGVVEVREDENGGKEAIIVNPRKDTVSREVLRHPEFEGLVSLGRKRDHFIYSIESIGQYDAQDILPAAVRVFLDKISTLRTALDAL